MGLVVLACTITACTDDVQNDLHEPFARVYAYDFPATDIWADSLANPGSVSDLGPAWPVGPNSQTRQLPSWKVGNLIFNPQTRYHVAVVDQLVWDGPILAGYWMEGVTSLHVLRPDLGIDTVLTLARCRFFAGTDSYPSTLGYKLWHRQAADGSIPVVNPWVTPRVNGTRIGVYQLGDTLGVRADMSLDGQTIAHWWIETP